MHKYPAKVLLFGEHTILRGSRALAVPYPALGGDWAWGESTQQQRLPDFANYLAGQVAESIDVGQFTADLSAGLYFASDIPTGYGLGSSGALCAGIFDRYATEAAREAPLAARKALLAQMESFFHGASSGIDPLLSSLNNPLCLHSDGQAEIVQLPAIENLEFFLLDTGQARTTGSLVQHFLQRYDEDAVFRRDAEERWIGGTERAIDAMLAGDAAAVWEAFTTISTFQYNQLPRMTGEQLRPLWETGLASDHFRLKICGAGGGGFALGISTHWALSSAQMAAAGYLLRRFAPWQQ
jgi:mevalonate kinase